MGCTILRSGDVETNPCPFGDSSDEEDFLTHNPEPVVELDPILSALGNLDVLINDDMEVVNILSERGGVSETGIVDDDDAARGSNDPPPLLAAPKPNRTAFKQKYTLF